MKSENPLVTLAKSLLVLSVIIITGGLGCTLEPSLDSEEQAIDPLAPNASKDLLYSDSGVPIRIFGTNQKGAETLYADRVVEIVREEFKLARDNTPYVGVDVRVVYNDWNEPNYLVAYLKHRDSFLLEVAKVVLDQYRVVSVEENYTQLESDLAQADDYAEKATCPDPSVLCVFATYVDEIPTAKAGVIAAAASAQNYGFKTVTLFDSAASVTAYKNWLACKNLKVLGNIGHGSTSGIMLGGGTLSSSYFTALPDTDLTKKILYFNSCQVHNNPLKSAVISAGTSRFIGGIPNLMIGPSEKVFKCFWEQVLKTKSKVVEQDLKTCEKNNYPEIGAHGISGTGPLPWDTGELGSTCTQDDECKSGFCADGTCCENDCSVPCYTCSMPNRMGSCVPANDNAPCPDNSLCNGDETCQAGVCKSGTPPVCKDTNPCTTDTCEPSTGCVYPPVVNGSACQNGDPCDGEETCQAGACKPGQALICNDKKECTVDTCEKNVGCKFEDVSNGTVCDGQQCGSATCQSGTCTPAPDFCADDNPCTKNYCDLATGCKKETLADGAVCGSCKMCQSGTCVTDENCVVYGQSSLFGGFFSCQTFGGDNRQDGALILGLVLVFLLRARKQ